MGLIGSALTYSYRAAPLVENKSNSCVKCYASRLRLSRNTSVKFSEALFTAWGAAEFLLLLHNVWANRLADIMFTFFHNFSYSLFHKQHTQL